MALRDADVDALGAALAMDRVDEQPEVRGLDAALGRDVRVLRRVDEMRLRRLNRELGPRLSRGERLDGTASEPFGWAVAMIALSGQAETQAMQPTHCSAMNCGICGERR